LKDEYLKPEFKKINPAGSLRELAAGFYKESKSVN
jgi:hypothetical protein